MFDSVFRNSFHIFCSRLGTDLASQARCESSPIQRAILFLSVHIGTGKDYHANFDSQLLSRIVAERLVPALDEIGPCLIKLDQASYHREQLEDFCVSRALRGTIY